MDLRAGSQQAGVLRSHVGELHAAHHLAGSQRNKITGSWDEQPVCRKCSGTTSLTGSPNFFFPTSPEADGHGEFSPQRVQRRAGRHRSPTGCCSKPVSARPITSGAAQVDRRRPEPNLVQMLNLTQAITPTVTTSMRYRSQNWLNNRTSGTHVERGGVVRDRIAQLEVRIPGESLARRSRDARQ